MEDLITNLTTILLQSGATIEEIQTAIAEGGYWEKAADVLDRRYQDGDTSWG